MNHKLRSPCVNMSSKLGLLSAWYIGINGATFLVYGIDNFAYHRSFIRGGLAGLYGFNWLLFKSWRSSGSDWNRAQIIFNTIKYD